MAYHFSRDDRSVQAALRRLALEQIDGALSDLRDSGAPPAATIHSARKRVKKLRGLLRLVKPVFEDFSQENNELRDTTKLISELRDAEVMLYTFDTLAAALPASDGLNIIRNNLISRIENLRDPARARTALTAFRDGLSGVRSRAVRWKIDAHGFAALDEGLADTWRRSRRAMKSARRALETDFDATPFHEWRKPVKDHWYQARLLAPVWPAMMAPHIAATDDLGEYLGDHNDLDVLAAHLAATHASGAPETGAPEIHATVATLALARRRALATRALSLGAVLLAGSADALTARWGAWWDAWRSRSASP